MDTTGKQRLDELASPRRNHFFYGKLLDEMHLRMEQDFFNGKRWMLNRLGLGRGVLCGLQVTADGKNVWVSPGVAIDAYGREIVVPQKVCIDPSKISADCGTVRPRDPEKEPTVYLALCYKECKADFVPALVTDCKPQDQCAPSTIVESYCLEVRLGTPPVIAPPSDELCEALNGGKDADDKRKRLCEVLAESTCGTVSGDVCVPLATIELAGDGKVGGIDTCGPREQVYSNDLLFDLLLCLHGGTQGPKGDRGARGLGLDPDLPKILDIAWEHNKAYVLYASLPISTPASLGDFLIPFLADGSLTQLALPEVLTSRIEKGDNPPLFTIYFDHPLTGIDAQTFTLRVRAEAPPQLYPYLQTLPMDLGIAPPGFYTDFAVCGDILLVSTKGRTPHTEDQFECAASFIPRKTFFAGLRSLLPLLWATQSTHLSLTLQLVLKGDFVWDDKAPDSFESLVLDADNIGGRVGKKIKRSGVMREGQNPSGNLTQGGDFESWLRLSVLPLGYQIPRQDKKLILEQLAALNATYGGDLLSAPVSVNVATAAQLTSAGLTTAQAEKIIEERKRRWFADAQDLAERKVLSDTTLLKIKDKIIVR